MAMLVDVHAHLDHPMFSDDLDDVIKRAKDAGVKAIIQNGINPVTNRLTLDMARKYDIIKAALGLYPVDALQVEVKNGEYTVENPKFNIDEELSFIEKNKENIVAIGEVGLDYKWVTDKCDEQKEIFGKIIALAEKIKKPLIVHSRKAEADIIDMLESSSAKQVVMHCFGGNMKLFQKARDNGWSFSIPANVLRNQHFQKIVSESPMGQILTETDCPFLSPERGKRNEPAFVLDSTKKIAELKGLTSEETESLLFMNYQRMFL